MSGTIDYTIHRINYTLLDYATDIIDEHIKDYTNGNMKWSLVHDCRFSKNLLGQAEETITFAISGGYNGKADWAEYFEQLAKFTKEVNEDNRVNKIWIINIKNDCTDDIWYAEFGIYVSTDFSILPDNILLDQIDILRELKNRSKEYFERMWKYYHEDPNADINLLYRCQNGIMDYTSCDNSISDIEFKRSHRRGCIL